MTRSISKYFDDSAIINGVKNYDDNAVDELYKKHKNYCIRFMASMYDDLEILMDIYHDAVIVLIENIRRKDLQLINTSIQTYLNSICRNQLLVRFKVAKKVRLVTAEEMENDFEEGLTDWLEELGDVKNDRILIILDELLKIKEEGGNCYQLLRLFFYEKRSMDFIAEKLGYTNAENAKNQKSRCQKRLRQQVLKRI